MLNIKKYLIALLIFGFSVAVVGSDAYAFNLNVIGSDGSAVGQYRWLIEEDATYHVVPGMSDPEPLGKNFHASYMPTVAAGDETTPFPDLDPTKHYFISVLPKAGYSIGGAQLAPGQGSVTVSVVKHPIPTAQISVLVFEDNYPIDGVPETPQESGLEGFTVVLEEAGGRYGQSGGQVMLDAFGNPLGTTYLPDGSVDVMGDSSIKTDANGEALIKYLSPGKYGIIVVPPNGQGWVQTSTIEGSPVIDAWVKPNEPPFFQEFGPPGPHVFIGFVQAFADAAVLTGGGTVTGRITNLHLDRPPNTEFYSGEPVGHTTPWIALNEMVGGAAGRGVYAGPADADANFSIPNVPPGQYQLKVWDSNLDLLIATLGITVPPGGLALGDVPVFQWFSRLENYVFDDENENGFMDPGELGIPEQAVNIRWRDGTIYQSFPTDVTGFVPFDEVFPFFHWLVAEVDFARLKATGLTVVVDAGGPINPANPWSFGGVLTPQAQPENSGLPYRTELGPVLTQGFQGFLGQTSVLMWGKKSYGPGENGGISGIVFYAVTRAENDPAYAAAEPWEPGIPRVVVNLYQDSDLNGIIDDLDGDGNPTLADVDNHPFDNFPGLEDVDRNDNGTFDAGDAIQITTSDSWDDNVPTNCPGDPLDVFYFEGRCYDGIRNWNQVRPGVFDGGYAFASYFPGGISSGSEEVEGLPAGTYIVEAIPPRSVYGQAYEILREEHKNVDFGDEYVISPLLLPPPCVGDGHEVPAELSLFPGIPSAYAGETRPLCDRKQVYLTDGKNAAADFFMLTEVPIAAHIVGMVLNDLANEFDPNSPQFGEKYAPPWIPISIRDWTGKEIVRTHTDEFGRYNVLVPSTFTADRPMPSGMAPNMLTVAINDPGPIPDPTNPGLSVIDPFYNRQYSQFSYTFQFMPGATTYLDTPVLPVAAFAGPDQYPLDCELPDKTPRIYTVSGPEGGPYAAAAGDWITITAIGEVEVPNPQYDGVTNSATIVRDYGFGSAKGAVTIGGVSLENVLWSSGAIKGRIAAGTSTGQLMVKRNDSNRTNITGVTFTVGAPSPTHVAQGGSIQDAIDAAQAGDLILVSPGTYDELVIMHKPVKLQGWGEASTTINAIKIPSEKLTLWEQRVNNLLASGAVDLLPAQAAAGNTVNAALFNEQGPGIIVLAKNVAPIDGGFGLDGDGQPNARIDGLTVTGADLAGGIFVNGYAHYLVIANNQVVGNNGIYGGGVRIGHADLETSDINGDPIYQSGFNDHIVIRNNRITRNATEFGAGGGLSIYTGTDSYLVRDNYICGNFSQTDGAGMGHLGLSDGGLIEHNTVAFNQSFNQGLTAAGGGIIVAGAVPLGNLSEGSGSVKVVSNLIQGNNSGAGDGGGIRTSMTNGMDVEASPIDPAPWYEIQLLNNTIINNVAGLAGGGISMQDTAKIKILHNTIVHNDSTATTGEAFTPGVPNQSNPQPAGIVARKHSAALTAAFGSDPAVDSLSIFSNPLLANNIIWENRSFYFLVDASQTPTAYLLKPDINTGEPPVYADLAVLGVTGQLEPMNCVLTDTTGYDPSNVDGDPSFVLSYVNGPRSSVVLPEPAGGIPVMPAFDEGGNFIDVRYGPLTLMGDHHIQGGSSALDTASSVFNTGIAELLADFEGDPRPTGLEADIGADEIYIVPNVDPIAVRDRVTTLRNRPVNINVLANDYDPDGTIDPSSVTIVLTPRKGGNVFVNSNGIITYTPRIGYSGNDFFTYTITDNRGGVSNAALVWVRVLRSRR